MPLKRELGLFDAMSIGIGAIVGAGIFVVMGVAAAMAGPALVVSLLISAFIAGLSALSFAQLAAAIPKEGGGYEYARELVSPFAGFMYGWLWLFTNIVVGAVVALGFAHYLSVFIPLPVNVIAAGACVAITVINYAGAKESGKANDILVVVKLAILGLFVALGIAAVKEGNLTPFAPHGGLGVLQGAALIFFAFGGFARITVVAEEVKEPAKNVPRAIILALAISTVVYILVGLTAVGLVGYARLGGTGSPLAIAATAEGNVMARLISVGALAATLSVLLTTVLGVSRTAYTMGRNRELPGLFARLHPARGVPHLAILVLGSLMAALALFTDITEAAAVSNFGLLAYYAIANISALKLKKPLYPKWVPAAGLASCLFLIPFLSPLSIAIGLAAVLSGAGLYLLRAGKPQKRPSHGETFKPR